MRSINNCYFNHTVCLSFFSSQIPYCPLPKVKFNQQTRKPQVQLRQCWQIQYFCFGIFKIIFSNRTGKCQPIILRFYVQICARILGIHDGLFYLMCVFQKRISSHVGCIFEIPRSGFVFPTKNVTVNTFKLRVKYRLISTMNKYTQFG